MNVQQMNGGAAMMQQPIMQGGQQMLDPQQLEMMQRQQNMAIMQEQMMQMQGQAINGGMGGMNVGQMMGGGYGFAAKPQVVKQKKYRDPYREYVKVAPQNIMYDRRIVRGNTYAALVIPVNMQPDPALIEKQRMEEAYMKQKREEMRQRRIIQERQREKEKEQEREQNKQMAAMQNSNQWEELSDHHNIINEEDLEADYYIDQAPDAIFIPNPEGDCKATQIFDEDPDLFDYEREVEPILQVLVGKSIEHARIEVIEEFEKDELKKHKSRFLQLKEAELMETQRLEEIRIRKNDEIDRRNLQVRTTKNQMVQTEKKIVARVFAKSFLRSFKLDSLVTLVDLGPLRHSRLLGINGDYVPKLYNQILADFQSFKNHTDELNEIIMDSLNPYCANHKHAIAQEQAKRLERKKEEMRRKREEEDARRKRKELRAALRENHRLGLLKEQILNEIVKKATNEEFNVKLQIYDLRNPQMKSDGFCVIGGFVGELIMSFTCLLDYILASPQNQNFFFSVDMIEQFLHDLLGSEESTFPDGVCTLNFTKELIGEGQDVSSDLLAKFARDQKIISDFGLRFMFEIQKDLVLLPEVIDSIYRAITRIIQAKPKALQAVADLPEDADDEAKEQRAERLEQAKEMNIIIEKENARLQKLKNKIKLNVVPEEEQYKIQQEMALLKMQNHRDNVPEPISTTLESGHSEEVFNAEKLSSKVLLVNPQLGENQQVAIYHSEAQYFLRRALMDQARKTFKELEKAEIVALLQHSHQRAKLLEDRLEEQFIKHQGYGKGCQYTDNLIKLTFKTFLQE